MSVHAALAGGLVMATVGKNLAAPNQGLGQLLRAHRDRANLTQEGLAARAGLSIRAIRDLESGRVSRPRRSSLLLLADALQLKQQDRDEFINAGRGATLVAASAPSTPAQLPLMVGNFVGRRRHLAALADALSANSSRVWTISGAPGVGKTALVIQWAHSVAAHFPDGQLYADLHGHCADRPLPPVEILARFLRALGTEPGRVPLEVDEATAMYRSLLSEKRVLVLLDNAADAEQVRPLLPGGSSCLTLVTSRDRLTGLVVGEGARSLVLEVMVAEESKALLSQILGIDRRVDPVAMAELASTCAHLPLALRIAAANLAAEPGLPIPAYVTRLRGDRIAGLGIDAEPVASVRTTFDFSYGRLSAATQRAFRLLALHPGQDFCLEAAAALTNLAPEQMRCLLDELVDAHLLEQQLPERWAFHDLLQEYAIQRTAADREAEQQQALNRLFEWCLAKTDLAARLVYPQVVRLPFTPASGLPMLSAFDAAADALAWLDTERANLLALMRLAAGRGSHPAAWQLADAMRAYFWLRGDALGWLSAARNGLAAAVAGGAIAGQAAAHLSLGQAHHRCLGQGAVAVEHYQAALGLARNAGWRLGEAAVLVALGHLFADSGRPREAAHHLNEGLVINRDVGSMEGEAAIRIRLGVLHLDLGDLAQAAHHLESAVFLSRKTEMKDGETNALTNLAHTYHFLGRAKDAQACLVESLEGSRSMGNLNNEAAALFVSAVMHHDAGQDDKALGFAESALAIARQVGYSRGEVDILNLLGDISLRTELFTDAVERYDQALGLAVGAEVRKGRAEALLGLAKTHLARLEYEQAYRAAQQALEIAERDGYRILTAMINTVVARIQVECPKAIDVTSSSPAE